MNDKQLKKTWLEEEAYAFQGWDFSHLNNRWNCEPAKAEWDYRAIVMKYLCPTNDLLDMGTGGGEFYFRSAIPLRVHGRQKHGNRIFAYV